MTIHTDPLIRAIDDARALLDTLLASDWHDIHVVSGETEIFIARTDGRSNPMRAVEAATSSPATPPIVSETAAAETLVSAPHVATVVDVLAAGTQVAAGERVATIRVLDSEETLAAPSAGIVGTVHARPGTLVEFKMPIVGLRGAA